MEKELFLSGYCRAMDSGRTVTALLEDGILREIDCNFEKCIHAASCPIGQQLEEARK